MTVATFVLEQHLGHHTYASNLRDSAPSDTDLTVHWVPVTYASADDHRRIPLPHALKAALAGRNEVLQGLRAVRADVHVFNTQVPAVLGGRRSRSRPYVLITDVTPVQYDKMADGYGHEPDHFAPLRRLKHHVNRKTFQEASFCVGWSSWAAESIVNDYGVDRSRVTVIPPGIDLGKWHPIGLRVDDRFRVLFVGGEFGRKGGQVLLEAFKSLSDRAELCLVTKSDVPSSDRVRVIQDLTPNDGRLIDLYASSDVFVLPSLAETFGIAAAEASAMGLPVVATSIGGLRDLVVADRSGLLVEPNDVAGLARALVLLESDGDARRRLGLGARAHAVESFDARKNAAQLFDLVGRAASGRVG